MASAAMACAPRVHPAEVKEQVAWTTLLDKAVAKLPVTPAKSHSFDFFEEMERGESPCLPLLPARPPQVGEEQRLFVSTSSEEPMITLQDAAGAVLLQARATRDGSRFDIFASLTGAPVLGARSMFGSKRSDEQSSLQPAFVLSAGDASLKTWLLTSSRCEGCERRGRLCCHVGCLARIQHYMEAIGAGKAYCMDVSLPRGEDGAALTSEGCVACQEASPGARAAWMRDATSRRPKWNTKHRTLTLNFRGRVSKASAKNFQLEGPVSQSPMLLFGKVDEGKFVLDYQAPLGMIQAFAAALTTFHWV